MTSENGCCIITLGIEKFSLFFTLKHIYLQVAFFKVSVLSQYLWLTTYMDINHMSFFVQKMLLNQRWKSLKLDSFSRNFLCSTLNWLSYSRCSRDREFPKFKKVLGLEDLSNCLILRSKKLITYNIDKSDNEGQLCCL